MITGVLFAALGPLVSNRAYPSRFPQEDILPPGVSAGLAEPTWPAIRYSVTGGITDGDLCGTDSVDTDNTFVQIDIVSKTHGGMITLRDQVIAALLATDPPCTRQSPPVETWDTETKTHRSILQYEFHASSPGGVSP